jgi:hypothetical protein
MAKTINVQFTDSAQTTVCSYFASPQPEFPNMGTVQSDDSRWADFYEALPPMEQSLFPTPGS